MKTNWKWYFCYSLALLIGAGLIAGCSGGSGGGQPGNASSGELFDHDYGYLVRNDPDFLRLAPNYSTLRPFNVDTALVVETKSEREGNKSPAPDFEEYLYVRVNRPMNLRLIVADSAGLGIIVYEFESVPQGSYTLGSKGWPVPQIEATKSANWVFVYVVGDQRLRDRRQFKLNSKRHFLLMPQSPIPTVPS